MEVVERKRGEEFADLHYVIDKDAIHEGTGDETNNAPGSSQKVDREYLRRSPSTWLKGAANVPVDLAAETERIPEAEIAALTAQPSVPEALQRPAEDKLYGSRRVLYRRQSRQVRVTLFEGGHEIVPNVALAWLSAQRKGQQAEWNPGPVTPGAVDLREDQGAPVESGK